MPLYLLLGLLATSASAREDSVVLVTGGVNSGGLYMSHVEVLGGSCPVADLPLPLNGHATVLTADGLVLTCGGMYEYDLYEYEYNLSCFVLDPDTNTWLLHSTLDSPRHVSATVSLPSGIFLLAHNTHENDETSSYLATGSTQWVPGPPLKRPTENPCAVSISASKFLLIGGLPDTHAVEEYDTITRAWTSWPELTVGRYGHSCSVIGDTVIIAGGASEETFQTLLSTTILDISSRSQRPGGNLDAARIYFAIVNHEDKLLATGLGQDNQGGHTQEWHSTEEVWTPREDLDMTRVRLWFGAVSAPRSAVCTANQ